PRPPSGSHPRNWAPRLTRSDVPPERDEVAFLRSGEPAAIDLAELVTERLQQARFLVGPEGQLDHELIDRLVSGLRRTNHRPVLPVRLDAQLGQRAIGVLGRRTG